MSRILKLHSVEGGPFTPTYNRVTYDVQVGGLLDLTKSYFNFVVSVPQAPASSTPVFLGRDGMQYYPVALIRHAKLISSTKGVLEEIPYVNILSMNLKYFQLDSDSDRSLSIYASSPVDVASLPTSGLTGVTSIAMPVPLSDVFGCASTMTDLDTEQLGSLRVELELESSQKLFQTSYFTGSDPTQSFTLSAPVGCADLGAAGTVLTLTGQLPLTTLPAGARVYVSYTPQQGGPPVVDQKYYVLARADTTHITLEAQIPQATAISFKYYSSAMLGSGIIAQDGAQKVTLQLQSAADPGILPNSWLQILYTAQTPAQTFTDYTLNTKVISATYNAGVATVTLATGLTPILAAGLNLNFLGISAIKIYGISNLSEDYSISKAELVLYQSPMPPKMKGKHSKAGKMAIRTFSCEPATSVQTTDYRRQFILEPGVVNAWIMPIGQRVQSESVNLLASVNNAGVISSVAPQSPAYRLSLDSVDLTSRDVRLDQGGTTLHQDRLLAAFANSPLQAVSIAPVKAGTEPVTFIAAPLTIVDEEDLKIPESSRMLSIKLTAGANLDSKVYYCFKEKYVVL